MSRRRRHIQPPSAIHICAVHPRLSLGGEPEDQPGDVGGIEPVREALVAGDARLGLDSDPVALGVGGVVDEHRHRAEPITRHRDGPFQRRDVADVVMPVERRWMAGLREFGSERRACVVRDVDEAHMGALAGELGDALGAQAADEGDPVAQARVRGELVRHGTTAARLERQSVVRLSIVVAGLGSRQRHPGPEPGAKTDPLARQSQIAPSGVPSDAQ
jgi:hypothetical protein